MQIDLEDAKGQLQNSLLSMQIKVDETNALLVMEHEAARKAIEEAPPVIKEIQVLVQDTETIDSLTAEVERLKTDLEEAKRQSQNSLQSMQKKVDETNALLVMEREAARKAIEEAPPVIKETQVLVQDTETIDSLTAEVERLKTDLEEAKRQSQNSLQSMQKKVDETNALLIKEREAAHKAIEEAPPVMKETQVLVQDTEMINSLTAEVERLKTDLEEVKGQLQNSLQSMQNNVDETNALLVKEREAARKAIEEAPPVIKEIQVLVQDTETVNSLMAEVERLKDLFQSEKQRADDFEMKFAKALDSNEEKCQKLQVPDGNVRQLQESLNRLEEKLTNLESENQVLRQQALSMAPKKRFLSGRSKSNILRSTESSAKLTVDPQIASSTPKDLSEVEEKPQKSLHEKQQENQDLLIRCIAQHLGFSRSRPIAACITYKCLLQWGSFELERTNIFDRIIQTIGHAIETQENNMVLAYWLSNTAMLLLLLQRTLKGSGAAVVAPQYRRSSSVTLFGRMTQSFRGSPQGVDLSFVNYGLIGGVDTMHQVEAKYPALLFKQQLTAYVEKIYGMIIDNFKKEISPLLGFCIQAPRKTRASLVKGPAPSISNSAAQQDLIAHWREIVTSLGNFLNTLKFNQVPPFLVRKVFTQIFFFINVQLFNSLLLRRECCSYANGEFVKAGLAELEYWCYKATDEYVGSAWEELKHIRQAIGFLVIDHKPKKTLDEIIHDLCPVLSVQQLYRISTMYWDASYETTSLSSDVISNLRVLMTEDSNNAVSSSFLLDDDSSIPFSIDDISKSIEQIDISNIEPPPLIRENSGFTFLLPRVEKGQNQRVTFAEARTNSMK